MKKNTILFGLFSSLIFISGFSYAQDLKRCGTMEAQEKLMQDDPVLGEKIRKAEATFRQQLKEHLSSSDKRTANSQSGTVYVIPVVFHIVHNYGAENISDSQVQDALAILTRDFRKLNADTSQIEPEFKNVAADCEIEFRLAQKDPKGNCATGIDRIASLATYNANDNSKLNQWDPKKYLNIWVVNSIGASGVAGYATFPSTGDAYPAADGIVILHDYVGRIGTGHEYRSRALTHEVGHYLSLYHVWGGNPIGTQCGDDGIGDTPYTKGWQHCNTPRGSVCTPGVVENVQNYMEYSYCDKMFSWGQKTAMRYTLQQPSGGRNNLWSPANRAATGTDGAPAVLCPPKSDFRSASYICETKSIQFSDESWRAPVTSWKWIINGSDSGTYFSPNPVVSFLKAGVYDVTLITGNSAGTDTLTRKAHVTVAPNIAWYGAPYTDTFNRDYLFEGWYQLNGTGDGTNWSISTAGFTDKCVKLNNFNATKPGVTHSLISPRLDLSLTSNATLKFKTAYAVKNSNNGDYFSVHYSVDCGYSWTFLAGYPSSPTNPGDPNFNNNGLWATAFTPTSQSQWKSYSLSLPPAAEGKTPVLFRFDFHNGYGGNNFYLDNVEISGITGIENTLADNLNLTVYPNPSSGSATISFNMTGTDNVSMEVLDVTGREIKTLLNNRKFTPGENHINVDIPAKGMYFVRTRIGNHEITRKLVIN